MSSTLKVDIGRNRMTVALNVSHTRLYRPIDWPPWNIPQNTIITNYPELRVWAQYTASILWVGLFPFAYIRMVSAGVGTNSR